MIWLAKGNARARREKKTHAACNDYKIPYKLREHKWDKWTSKEGLRKIKEMKRYRDGL